MDGIDRVLLQLVSRPCMALLLAGPGAIAAWAALAQYETARRGTAAERGAALPVLMHASATRLHAEREIAFFFDPKDAGPGATAPPTASLAAGAERGPDVVVGRQVLVRYERRGVMYDKYTNVEYY